MPFPAGEKKPRINETIRSVGCSLCIGADLTFWPVPEFAPPSGHFLDHAGTPVRSPSAAATRTILIGGNGAAASIRANISPTPPRPSPRPAPISNANGGRSCRNAPSPIFRHSAIREIGPRGNMRCGIQAKRLEPPAMDRGNCASVRKCPCGEIFDIHGPEAVLVHVCLTSRRPNTPKKASRRE
jgi:hypothetical protein